MKPTIADVALAEGVSEAIRVLRRGLRLGDLLKHPVEFPPASLRAGIGDAPMIKAKRVRIMAEHGCDGLWNDGGAIDLDELPISEFLKEKFAAWHGQYCLLLGPVCYPHLDHEPFDKDAFSAEGLLIAREIRTQLPDWSVEYFHEALSVWMDGDEIS